MVYCFPQLLITKLVKANKCLHVLRTLRKEHYFQAEIDHLFISIVLPNFSYALSVFGASESDPTVIQNFYTDTINSVLFHFQFLTRTF